MNKKLKLIAIDAVFIFSSILMLSYGLSNLAILIFTCEEPATRAFRLIVGILLTGIGSTVFSEAVRFLRTDLKEQN